MVPMLWLGQAAFILFRGGLVSLFVYAVLASDRDGYAFSQLLSSMSPDHKLVTRGLLILLYLVCLTYVTRQRFKLTKPVRKKLFLVNFLIGLIFIVSLLKGEDLLKSLSHVVYSGAPVFVIWIAAQMYDRRPKAVLIFVFIQIGISLLVLSSPTFSMLDGGIYKAMEGIFVIDNGSLNFSLPTGQTDKGAFARYAQYHNPNALGLYAAASIVCGYFCWISRSSRRDVIVAAFFLFAGTIGWLNSLTRGPLLLAILGIGLVSLFQNRNANGSSVNLKRALFIIVFIFSVTTLVLLNENVAAYFFPDSSNISVSARQDGYTVGFNVIHAFPLLGIPGNWVWEDLSYPHFIGLAFAAEYGILAGLLIMIIVFFWGSSIILAALRKIARGDRQAANHIFSILMILTIFGSAITNNLTAPILFWIFLAESTVIAHGLSVVKAYRS